MAMRGVLLTGVPGVGKSTACRKVAELCRQRGLRVEGFITEELRERGQRVGFDVVELGGSGRRVPLARADGGKGPRVGKYAVALAEFESLALPILERVRKVPPGDGTVCIIDEIGKMELFSSSFVSQVRDLLTARPVPMLFTIALYGGGFIAEAKRVRGLDLVEINQGTRDGAPADIISRLLGGPAAAAAASSGPRGGRGEAPKESPRGEGGTARGGREAAGPLPAAPRRWQRKSAGDAAPSATSAPAKGTAPASASGASAGAGAASGTGAGAGAAGPAGRAAPRKGGRVVLWLRAELRLGDNPLLMRAIGLCKASDANLLPVYCLDPKDFGPEARTAFGSPKVGTARRRFLEECLADLASSLASRGSRLLVCDAAPELVLPAVAGAGDLVLASREACPEELAAEARVSAALDAAGAGFELHDGGGVTALFGREDLAAARLEDGPKFPEDFKVYYDAVRPHVDSVCQAGLCEAPAKLPPAGAPAAQPPGLRAESEAPSAAAAGAAPELPAAAGPAFRGGEAEGLTRLRAWLRAGGLRSYKANFRRLLGDYSSRLSAHLALGCVSPRRLCAEALSGDHAPPQGHHVEHFVYELCWRDFFRHVARRWGARLFLRGGPLGESRAWRRDADAEDRWKRGATGLPLVDAAMRELAATGYMGNLARQFVAAYLLEEQGIDWRVGADWFETALVDYDPHSNWGQWTRSAGTAPTNEAKRRRVGGTRYFDIALGLGGGEAARYVRGWVPELRELPDGELLAPWRSAGAAEACGYTAPPLCSKELQAYFEAAAAGGGAAGAAQGAGRSRGKGGGWRKGGKGRGRG